MPDYDYCIVGAGCAGLSLLVRMLMDPVLRQKKILLVDRVLKTTNDRTWCFWEKDIGVFEDIVYHRWSKLWFHDSERSRLMETQPYVYKVIRGIDFYQYCFGILRHFENVTFVVGDIERLYSDGDSTYAIVNGEKITARYIFNSIPFGGRSDSRRSWRLLQHFKGWVIRPLGGQLDPEQATIMDFRTSQERGTSFFYVLPFSPDRALVECTFFSEKVLPESDYTSLLTQYISRVLKIRDYIIEEKELGVIPMSTAAVPQREDCIRHIGAAAGLTKPSSGYTFQYIQCDSEAIVESLVREGLPCRLTISNRFHLYDRILLNALVTGKISGEKVFSSLFGKTRLPDLFAFLDNASTVVQDWSVIRSLPKLPFLRAAVSELLGLRPMDSPGDAYR